MPGIKVILSGIKLNVPLEKLLKNFAERANIEDLNLFVAVFEIARKRWKYDSCCKKRS